MNKVTIRGTLVKKNDKYINQAYKAYFLFTPSKELINKGFPKLFLCHLPNSVRKGKNNIYNASSIVSLMDSVEFNKPVDVLLTYNTECGENRFRDGMRYLKANTGWTVTYTGNQLDISDLGLVA